MRISWKCGGPWGTPKASQLGDVLWRNQWFWGSPPWLGDDTSKINHGSIIYTYHIVTYVYRYGFVWKQGYLQILALCPQFPDYSIWWPLGANPPLAGTPKRNIDIYIYISTELYIPVISPYVLIKSSISWKIPTWRIIPLVNKPDERKSPIRSLSHWSMGEKKTATNHLLSGMIFQVDGINPPFDGINPPFVLLIPMKSPWNLSIPGNFPAISPMTGSKPKNCFSAAPATSHSDNLRAAGAASPRYCISIYTDVTDIPSICLT